MARYKIYDNSSDVITPVGEVLTAEQWLDRYPWGRFAKMIVAAGQAVTSAAAPPTRTTSPPWRPLRTPRLRTPASPTRPALRTRWKIWWP